MKIPGILFAVLLTIVSPLNAAFTSSSSVPRNLQDCFARMSRTSDSYPIFSPASRQRYCVKQYLNKRHRSEWPLEPPVIPAEPEGFKESNFLPTEPQPETTFWVPPTFKQWRFPRIRSFWQPKTRFWPVFDPTYNEVWKPATNPFDFQNNWKTNSFNRFPNSKTPIWGSGSQNGIFQPITTTTPAPTTTTTVATTTTNKPPNRLNWNRNNIFNSVLSNPDRSRKYWRMPMWSVIPKVVRLPKFRLNNEWIYPNWAPEEQQFPLNDYREFYNVPEYPMVS